jgi:hypothetical protein
MCLYAGAIMYFLRIPCRGFVLQVYENQQVSVTAAYDPVHLLSCSVSVHVQPTSYRAPHSGQIRITRLSPAVEFTGLSFPEFMQINDVWNPRSYPQFGQTWNSFPVFIVCISASVPTVNHSRWVGGCRILNLPLVTDSIILEAFSLQSIHSCCSRPAVRVGAAVFMDKIAGLPMVMKRI